MTYAAPVKNVHVFWPVGGGANVVHHPPATASKVYSLAVPAGSYALKYVTQTTYGGYPPFFYSYDPVIVIHPPPRGAARAATSADRRWERRRPDPRNEAGRLRDQ